MSVCRIVISRSQGRLFLYPESVITMTRDELISLVKSIRSDTLIAVRMYDALGLPHALVDSRSAHHAHSGKRKKYRGARKLMAQKYGVRL